MGDARVSLRILGVLFLMFCVRYAFGEEPAPQGESSMGVAWDFVECMESNDCGLDGVCAFELVQDGRLCNADVCPKAAGYIVVLRNEMDYPVELKWDVLDDGPDARTTHSVTVPAGQIRYLDTHHAGTQTVRLYSGSEPLDQLHAFGAKRCQPTEACDYLLRACYAAKDPAHPDCRTYEGYCRNNVHYNSDGAACVEGCYETHWPHLQVGEEAQRACTHACAVDASHVQTLNAASTAQPSSDAALIAMGVIIIVLIATVFFCGYAAWKADRFAAGKRGLAAMLPGGGTAPANRIYELPPQGGRTQF